MGSLGWVIFLCQSLSDGPVETGILFGLISAKYWFFLFPEILVDLFSMDHRILDALLSSLPNYPGKCGHVRSSSAVLACIDRGLQRKQPPGCCIVVKICCNTNTRQHPNVYPTRSSPHLNSSQQRKYTCVLAESREYQRPTTTAERVAIYPLPGGAKPIFVHASVFLYLHPQIRTAVSISQHRLS